MSIENKVKELTARFSLPENSEKFQLILRGTDLNSNEEVIRKDYKCLKSLIDNPNTITSPKLKQLDINTINTYIKRLNYMLDKEGWK